jgi:hypothetical protein
MFGTLGRSLDELVTAPFWFNVKRNFVRKLFTRVVALMKPAFLLGYFSISVMDFCLDRCDRTSPPRETILLQTFTDTVHFLLSFLAFLMPPCSRCHHHHQLQDWCRIG